MAYGVSSWSTGAKSSVSTGTSPTQARSSGPSRTVHPTQGPRSRPATPPRPGAHRGQHDEVATAATPRRLRQCRQGDVVEQGGQRRDLRPREGQRRVVDEVRGIHAVGGEDPLDLAQRLAGGEVPGHADPAERVTHDEVQRPGLHPSHPEAGVLDAHAEVGSEPQPQSFHVDLEHARVDLGHGAPGARPGLGQVARQGQPTTPQVVRPMGCPTGKRASTAAASALT